MSAPSALASALASRYRLDRELGAGGMATVWLAHDLKHDRPVALKVLRPELAEVLGGERFLREIRVTARLQHPHILPLLDSGEADGLLYYVMPYVEGESLRQHLEREGQLPLDEALAFTRQVAAALDCAHRQGIVHRDVKPENILLSRGEAVVSDFGIALAMRAAGGPRLTGTGLSLGTPQYMSPEQAAGDREVDARSDVYSLGAVLYEMLVGEPPHAGTTAAVVLAKLLTADPLEPRAVRRGVPEHVNQAVLKALAKTPADRHATAGALAEALMNPAPALAEPLRRSVAVLPFANLSADPDDEYFSDGLTEDLIARLSRTASLKVVSRTSVMRFKRTTRSISEIAATLGVDTILEGSMRRAAGRVRITALLVDARTDEHLMSETYDRQLTDVLEVQAEVAEAIVSALGARLEPHAPGGHTQRPVDIETYNLCLLGRHHWHRWTEDDFRRSIEYYERALLRDPESSVAHYGLGLGLGTLALGYWSVRGSDLYPRARRELDLALAAEPDLADALAWRAAFRWQHEFDWAGAEEDLGRALAADPNCAIAHDAHGWFLTANGRHAEAARETSRAAELDPLSVFTLSNAALAAYRRRDHDTAVALFDRVIALDPNLPMGHSLLALPLVAQSRFDEALATTRRGHKLFGPSRDPLLAYALAAAGQAQEAQAILKECEARRRTGGHVWPVALAMAYARCGEPEKALDRLDDGLAERDFWVTWLAVEPGLDPLRDLPRFRAILEKVGLARVATSSPREHAVGESAPARVQGSPEAAAVEATPERSLVVLPFENLSPDPDNAFFADGLTEELIAALSKVRALRVISRTTAMLLKGSKKDVPTIARELNVRYVLEGSVRRAGNNLRITAQLLDAPSDAHLWAEAYSGTLEDVFGIQEKVARAIAAALEVTLDAGTSAKLAARPIANAAAYDCYLRGVESMWELSAPGLARAVEHLRRGVDIEPDSALLHGALAYVWYQHANAGMEPLEEFRKRAREEADRAFALDPEAPLAHLAIGLLIAWEDPAEGIRSFKRILHNDPNHVEALIWLAAVVSHACDADAARPAAQTVRRLDPLHPMVDWIDGAVRMFAGDFERAARHFSASVRTTRSPVASWFLGLTLAYLGRGEESCSCFDEAFKGDEENVAGPLNRTLAHIFRGEREQALAILRTNLDVREATHRDCAYALFLAECHSLLEDTAGGLDWIERAVSLGNINYPFLSRHDPFLAPLRSEPRFRELMVRVKSAWEAFEA